MKPMFSYFGAKWRLSKYLPAPREGLTIVEPFAGSACYSLRYGANREVLLVDKNPVIVEIWNYLIEASPDEILSLPDIEPGRHIDSYCLPSPSRNLIGFWLNKGNVAPRNILSKWGKTYSKQFWGSEIKARIVSQLPLIRHWRCLHGDYEVADIGWASYHVDPPYQEAGVRYINGSRDIDYERLGLWCRQLAGEVHVCENTGVDWLPFEPFREVKATSKKSGAAISREALWCNDELRQRSLPFIRSANW